MRRLPADPAMRERQLVRVAMAAGSVGLAGLMLGRTDEAAVWLGRSAERYRQSFATAPPESWGRTIGSMKARVLAGDWAGAREDATWTLEHDPAGGGSPIGMYAAALAALILEDDREAARLADSLREEGDETFPKTVSSALRALAERDRDGYAHALHSVLRSFEARDAYLEDVPVADTVVVLETLAGRRGIAARPESPLLP